MHKLIMIYKMNHSLTPPYLSSLIPSRVGDTTTYPLRNSSNLRNINCRTQLLSKSFLPSSISLWNTLPESVRSSPSLPSFKYNLTKNKRTTPLFYYDGDRKWNVIHARLRMHCSKLNEHLYSKNIVDSPFCHCGQIEDTYHFFFLCPLYQNIRDSLFAALSDYRPISIHLILFGSKVATPEANRDIFKHVQTYIRQSNRF